MFPPFPNYSQLFPTCLSSRAHSNKAAHSVPMLPRNKINYSKSAILSLSKSSLTTSTVFAIVFTGSRRSRR